MRSHRHFGPAKHVLALVIIVATARRGHAEPRSNAFLEADVGFGIASVTASQGLCGSYAAPKGMLPMLRGGVGGGVFIAPNLALVGRAHASDATSSGASSLAFFVGGGLQIRIAQLSTARDYVYLEVVPGYEAAWTPEVGNNASLGLATRIGVNWSALTLALGATLQVDPATRAYTQQDVAIVLGVHVGWLTD